MRLKHSPIIWQESNKFLPNSTVRKIHQYGGKKVIVYIEKAIKKLPMAIFPSPSIKLYFHDKSVVHISFFNSTEMRDIAYRKILRASTKPNQKVELDFKTYFEKSQKLSRNKRKEIYSLYVPEIDKKLIEEYNKRNRPPFNEESFRSHRLWGRNKRTTLLNIIETIKPTEDIQPHVYWKTFFNYHENTKR